MLKVNCLIMETCKFVVILLLYCVTTAYCYPSKPLNERSPDLTWQAWLLLDDQNQNKQQTNADGMLRRRITPKSVFIAPTFSPDSLPPCADGYTSDVMGRCVPIIKIDEDAHYGFLIQRLKDKFGPLDYEDYQLEDEMSTQGPLQLNIPLQSEEDDDEETDVAIVISPTKMLSANVDKRGSSVDDEKKQEFFLKKLAATTTKQPDETTTILVPMTDLSSEKTNTVTEELIPVTEPLTTTEEDIAISTLSHNTKRSTDNLEKDIITTTEELPDTTTFEPTTVRNKEISTFAPKVQLTNSESHTPIVFKFPEEVVTQNFKNTFVKFPDTDISFQTQIPSSVESIHNTRDVSNDAPFPHLADTPESDRKVVFREQSQPEETNLDYSNGARHFPPSTTNRNFNRRNRDKSNSMFLLPPRWSQSNFQKPLVLRFSRKHAYLDEAQFRHPDYYRAVPMDDYAFLFSKHKQSSHR
ncbi:uncharacterized protein LOC108905290 [Anoplophora glabripennis]|uniref:uncharacterized protein LOC108905290 n=1 Tax=Anoplophora glabripennis TaxID=217634 RepID=UPI000874B60D|nr:uncharacterized protein LOC108905290 [Anoplophora glabripennis]XP_018563609.1 uncharacterized protein LOC108905290 [Anoplophora glabripennis]